jgi:hypothetical protein
MESHSLAEALYPAQKVLFWEVTAYHGIANISPMT